MGKRGVRMVGKEGRERRKEVGMGKKGEETKLEGIFKFIMGKLSC